MSYYESVGHTLVLLSIENWTWTLGSRVLAGFEDGDWIQAASCDEDVDVHVITGVGDREYGQFRGGIHRKQEDASDDRL